MIAEAVQIADNLDVVELADCSQAADRLEVEHLHTDVLGQVAVADKSAEKNMIVEGEIVHCHPGDMLLLLFCLWQVQDQAVVEREKAIRW